MPAVALRTGFDIEALRLNSKGLMDYAAAAVFGMSAVEASFQLENRDNGFGWVESTLNTSEWSQNTRADNTQDKT